MTPATETNSSRASASRRPLERARSTLAQLTVKCPSAMARSTAGVTPGHFERDREQVSYYNYCIASISAHVLNLAISAVRNGFNKYCGIS